MSSPDQPNHRYLDVNGTRIHIAEQGEGPLVLMVHGFPELWYSWRHQLPFLAELGYHAVAIDRRGYGRSSKFRNADCYRIDRHIGDLLGVMDALDAKQAVLIGHDWGAPAAWLTAWLHPERVRGVMGVAVPFAGRGLNGLPGAPFGEIDPKLVNERLAGDGNQIYQDYLGGFDAPIAEIEPDIRGWLRDFVISTSADVLRGHFDPSIDPVAGIPATALVVPAGAQMRDRLQADCALTAWFDAADLDYYAGEFERSGFGGALMDYHMVRANWRWLEPHADKPLTVPAYFLGAELDVVTWWTKETIERAPERVKNLVGSRIVPDCGHWIQQEKPAETNAAIRDFLSAL